MTRIIPALLTISLTLATLLYTASAASLPTAHHTAHRPRTFFFPRFAAEKCRAQPALICNVQPTAGNTVNGTVLFTPVFVRSGRHFRCLVKVTAEVANLPGNAHGFHIHMYGDLSTDDGSSTGPHFANPQGIPIDHGFSSDTTRHWGDLDNLIVGEDGIANYERIDKVIQLGGIVGRGITIHIGEDMGSSVQPTGGSGARIAFCTIGYANPASLE